MAKAYEAEGHHAFFFCSDVNLEMDVRLHELGPPPVHTRACV